MAAPWMDAAESCAGCGGALVMDALAALGQKWHPACFVCGTCGGAFDGTFMEHEGRPYHKDCYNQNFGKPCKGCGKIIEGKFVVAQDEKYHPGCFVCAECGGGLEGGFVLSPDGRPFCAKHVNKAKSSKPKAVGSAGGEAADVAAAAEIGRAKAAQQAAEAATGGDGFTIDIKTGEKVYVEAATKRKYRLGPEGKLYEDEKVKKSYGGATGFNLGGKTSWNDAGRAG
uniref:LIM zinc-binding domain-containing protein n=1 Tax=Haptolina ericina TaxID=156174 RepID=A0A7S3ADW6_9EUKA